MSEGLLHLAGTRWMKKGGRLYDAKSHHLTRKKRAHIETKGPGGSRVGLKKKIALAFAILARRDQPGGIRGQPLFSTPLQERKQKRAGPAATEGSQMTSLQTGVQESAPQKGTAAGRSAGDGGEGRGGKKRM